MTFYFTNKNKLSHLIFKNIVKKLNDFIFILYFTEKFNCDNIKKTLIIYIKKVVDKYGHYFIDINVKKINNGKINKSLINR